METNNNATATYKVSEQTAQFVDCMKAEQELENVIMAALEDTFAETAEQVFKEEFGGTFVAIRNSIGKYIVDSITDNLGLIANEGGVI